MMILAITAHDSYSITHYSQPYSHSYTGLDRRTRSLLNWQLNTRTSSSQPSLATFHTLASHSSVKQPDRVRMYVGRSIGVCFGFHFSCRRTSKRDGVPRIVWFTNVVCVVCVCCWLSVDWGVVCICRGNNNLAPSRINKTSLFYA